MLTFFFQNLFPVIASFCNSIHVLIGLIKSWKKLLNQEKFVGVVLMDLLKVFDCILLDLLLTKTHAYGFSIDPIKLFYSYLKRQR